ncbi:MAG: pilus assembly PilX family protein [Gallionellaceae bacterium]
MNTLAKYPSSNSRQRGSALFIALISLVTMTLAGIALVRSVDTSNLIAGNFAFRQAALQATDAGVELAVTKLGTTIVTTSLDANFPAGCTSGSSCSYYPTLQATDPTTGIPLVAGTWASVPSTTINSYYKVQYLIDRLCQAPAPVTNISVNCYASNPVSSGTKNAGGVSFTGAQQVYYRVTVRVSGPSNTVSMVQAILSR